MKTYKFQHIQAFVEHQNACAEKERALAEKDKAEKNALAAKEKAKKEAKERRSRRWSLVVMLVIAIFPGCLSLLLKKAPAPEAKYIEGRFAASNVNARGNDRIWGVWIQSAQHAVELWRDRGVSVPNGIHIVYDPTVCGEEAIACANEARKTIWVSTNGDGYDRTSVMLHEVGHLLGVPHIEGDELMDAKYSGMVERPSDAALAIAKSLQNRSGVFFPSGMVLR